MSGGRFGSASGIRRTINATFSPFKSFRQITPSHRRHIPVRRERCIKGVVFCVHPDGRSPQANAGFRNGDEGGASMAKQEFLSDGRCKGSFSGETGSFSNRKEPRTSGRGLAVRFGPASWSSLVICFCRLEGDVFWWSCSPRCMFLLAGEGFSFVGEVPFSLRSLNAAFVGDLPA